jgi:hypothetical protein
MVDESARLRHWVYALLLAVVAGAAVGRIFAAERVYEPSLYKENKSDPRPLSVWPKKMPTASPLFGSNDRSRWATIRALVDHGTYAIGERQFSPDGETFTDRNIWRESGLDPEWDTVDKVLHPQSHKFYSSKPPLLSTVLAGLYWLLQLVTGWTLAGNIFEVVRTMLVLVNVVPFLVYLVLISRLAERFTSSDWAKLYMVTAACFATLVTPFLVTLNNHNIATYCVLFAMYATLLVFVRRSAWHLFLIAGLLSAFAATCELPAAAFAAGLGLVLLWREPRRTLLFFVPAALFVVAAFFLTNWLETGELRPAYDHFGTEWYTYKGSHWEKPKRGIDFARANGETLSVYAFHVLIGHHGLFSLTPIWLLAFAGMALGIFRLWRRKNGATPVDSSAPQQLPRWFFSGALLLSLLVIGFYLVKSDNYGGWTSGLRWLMWLTPIWLLCMLPVLDKLACRRWGRGLGYLLLALSVLSVSYPAWNPWRHPWIYRFMDAHGWIPY